MLARILLDSNDEEYIHSGISRYYYGAFGVIRRYLINVKGKYYLKSQSSDVHKDSLMNLDYLGILLKINFLNCSINYEKLGMRRIMMVN